nr:6-phosphogluconolactonase 5 (PGL5) [Polytomella parva]|mmetsp:Transcript_32421/g.58886  ORF Transcript_32421/g.58886 Transcript_32421/m.58886 type:complete len:361 (-) Transcript_32421:197-1279(-)|eukprot:CAMPEP_0175062872 /NCGR_PEP_ID=MMETSP0052_2-20121109/14417_1 /TAXON_ID=51329 ORGANISM="Polytomella parva, Strain SAG 63-3" /NCGR_SAMPLE_ID=MMETSP0052_2 /ASSEMBLY_ACC=CAM_ASM_000194 /LENGTH=360 /DNA_ID=CAMNT_0016328957 /DNA_START=114 /DNA_END=1196 /DNA_ORIENTATION=+
MLSLKSPISNVTKNGPTNRSKRIVVAVTASSTLLERVAHLADDGKPYFNLIPNNGRWPKGIPPVMGGHLMDSGVVSPISVSKGAGVEITPHQFQYPTSEGHATINIANSKTEVSQLIAKTIFESAKAAIDSKGSFCLVLSGCSVPNHLDALSTIGGIDWSKVYVFFLDERIVPLTDAESHYHQIKTSLFSKVPIPTDNIFAISEGLSAKESATNYEGRLLQVPKSILPRSADGAFPVFDLVLLGCGVEGRFGSMFPNCPQLAVKDKWVVSVEKAAKPPAQRIALSLPVINAAKEVLFVVLGGHKAEIVERVLETQSLPGSLPAQLVRPSSGRLQWLLDTESSRNLHLKDWGNAKRFPRSE